MTKAREIADLGSSATRTAGSNNKNFIINGAMEISQRGTSFTGPSSGAYTLDRWVSGLQTTSGAGDFSQATDVPTATQSGTAFKNSLKFQVTTADASIAATDRTYLVHKIEGQNLVSAGFGQSGTRNMTLSFWHKHTKTGTHSLAINNGARDRSYPMEYTQTTTNTWEKAELTFPVDTSGTWPTDNTAGMWIFWGIAFGSNYAGTANAWAAAQAYGTSSQVNNFDSTSNAMLFTGIQLELGDKGTEFEHQKYADQLQACQRYYFSIGGDANYERGAVGYNFSTTLSRCSTHFPTTMRAAPSTSISGNLYVAIAGSEVSITSASNDNSSRHVGHMGYAVSSGLTAGDGATIFWNANTTARIMFDAEL